MKFFKHFIVLAILVISFVILSSKASAQPRFRGGFFFNAQPMYYSQPMYYDYYGPVYRPVRPWNFGYYRRRPGRAFGLNFSQGGFGFMYESNRGRRNGCDNNGGNRRGNRRDN